MGDIDTSKIVTVWCGVDANDLCLKGYTLLARGSVFVDDGQKRTYWLLTPPEPTKPTLAERIRRAAEVLDANEDDPSGRNYVVGMRELRSLADRAADALEHYARVEAAASEVVASWDRADRRAMVSIELLWRLADALNEGKKAAGAKAFTGGDQ